MRKAIVGLMDSDDLDELDEAILDYLKAGRGTDEPWGIATPAVLRKALIADGHDPPTRQTINNRMVKMALAGHLENRFGKGEYVFVSDPREQE